MVRPFIGHTGHTISSDTQSVYSPLDSGRVTILVHLGALLVLALPPALLHAVEEVQLAQPGPGQEPPEVAELQQLSLCQQSTLRREKLEEKYLIEYNFH